MGKGGCGQKVKRESSQQKDQERIQLVIKNIMNIQSVRSSFCEH